MRFLVVAVIWTRVCQSLPPMRWDVSDCPPKGSVHFLIYDWLIFLLRINRYVLRFFGKFSKIVH